MTIYRLPWRWVVVLGLLALLLPSAARAGEPPTLGATLGATPDVVVIDSTATTRQRVILQAPDGWRMAEETFIMDPGERRRVTIVQRGPAGQIVATFVAVDLPPGMDTAALVLALGVAPPGPDIGVALWMLAILAMAASSAAVAHRRMRRLAP